MNNNISNNPWTPSVLKLTAHGYIKITSTSNNTKRIATRKYLIENGIRALPCDSIPHSNVSSLIFDFRFGPKKWVATIVVTTKPAATKNWIRMGRKSEVWLEVFIFDEIQRFFLNNRQIYAFYTCLIRILQHFFTVFIYLIYMYTKNEISPVFGETDFRVISYILGKKGSFRLMLLHKTIFHLK